MGNPQNTLDLIWLELNKCYGDHNKVFLEIDRKLSKFNIIKNACDVKQWKDLFRL